MGRGFACKYFHEPSDNLSILGGPPSLPATGFSVFERSFPFHVAAFLVPFLYPHTWKCMLRFVLASTPARLFVRVSVKLYKMFTLAGFVAEGLSVFWLFRITLFSGKNTSRSVLYKSSFLCDSPLFLVMPRPY